MLRKVEQAAKLANNTKSALNEQIDEIKAFLEGVRASPAQIQEVIDEVLSMSIPYTEEQIREMSEKVGAWVGR